jgi:hypothetical protein
MDPRTVGFIAFLTTDESWMNSVVSTNCVRRRSCPVPNQSRSVDVFDQRTASSMRGVLNAATCSVHCTVTSAELSVKAKLSLCQPSVMTTDIDLKKADNVFTNRQMFASVFVFLTEVPV